MIMKKPKIVFMGTPEISAFVLESLIQNGYNVVAVIAQPDRPVGRKQILEAVPTKVVANKYGIRCFQPIKIRNDYSFLLEIKPDLIITLAYGQIVPQSVLNIPKFGCVNLHGSILPKYRGAAPIQYALLNGDKETGMSLMKMTAAMDAGDVYAVKQIKIDDDDNCTTLFNKMAVVARDLILESLPKLFTKELIAMPQDENFVTFSPSIKPEEEKIDLSSSCSQIINKIRALSYQPGAYLLLNDEKLKIYKAKLIDRSSGETGKIIKADKNGLYLQCQDGVISLLEVQRQGKKRMKYNDFVNGNSNILGQKLI